MGHRGAAAAQAGKKFERYVDSLIGTKRKWSNSGETVDTESDRFVVQAKNVTQMSLEALTKLAQTAAADGQARGKVGIVAIRLRAGSGRKTGALLVIHEDALLEAAP